MRLKSAMAWANRGDMPQFCFCLLKWLGYAEYCNYLLVFSPYGYFISVLLALPVGEVSSAAVVSINKVDRY